MQPRKISMAEIQQVQRVLESAPKNCAEEFTKMEAIRMLAPQIQEIKSKGYALSAVAGLLSDNGIAVTSMTLKNYLNQAKGTGRRKTVRKPKPHAEERRSGPAESPSVGPVVPSAATRSIARATGDSGASGEKAVRKPVPAATSTSGAVELPKQVAPHREEGGARRSAFVPRKDTEDI